MTRGCEYLSRMRSRLLLGAAAAMLLPAGAQAQEAQGVDQAGSATDEADIIVTAQKRSQSSLAARLKQIEPQLESLALSARQLELTPDELITQLKKKLGDKS